MLFESFSKLINDLYPNRPACLSCLASLYGYMLEEFLKVLFQKTMSCEVNYANLMSETDIYYVCILRSLLCDHVLGLIMNWVI